MKEQIKENHLEDYEEPLLNSFNYFHQWSLRERLNDIFNEYQNILPDSISYPELKDKFIDKVVKTRNNMTHLIDNKGKPYKIPLNKELQELSEPLKIILEACLLNELGFTSEQIKSILKC